MGQRRAAIFDVDGVLVDSEPLHALVVREILAREGQAITDTEYTELIGRDQVSAWQWLKVRFGLSAGVELYMAAYETELVHRVRESVLEPLPCAREVVARWRNDGLALAAASSSSRSVVSATLARIGLSDAFDVRVGGDDVARGKPDPGIFLAAARLLSVAPRACVVIEDSVHGITAARSARMAVIAVRGRYTTGTTLDADHVVGSLCELLDAPPL
jgi:HAD superfamily hydrolase (TIGR01509 family)